MVPFALHKSLVLSGRHTGRPLQGKQVWYHRRGAPMCAPVCDKRLVFTSNWPPHHRFRRSFPEGLMRCSARRRVTPYGSCGLVRRGARLCGGYTSSVRLTAATFPSKGKAVWLAGHTGPPDKNWQIAPYSLPPFEGAGPYEVSSFCNDCNRLLGISSEHRKQRKQLRRCQSPRTGWLQQRS